MIGAVAGPSSQVASALSVAIFYALWQGVLIGLITAGTLAAMSRASARSRYLVACLALATMLVAFAATFGAALHGSQQADAVTAVAGKARPGPGGLADLPPPFDRWPRGLGGQLLPNGGSAVPIDGSWLAVVWLAGVALVALTGVLQFVAVRRLTGGARFDVHDRWRETFEAVSRDLRLDRLTRLAHSAAVEVPTAVGWLAPIVVVPFTSCTGLSRDEMCGILAHELAHIRRCDYLVNAVQKVVEAVLFFHPVTWWLSRRIRQEREYCCDDLAVHYTNSALGYARALSHLETLRTRRPAYAMGANGGSLMNRIARIVGAKPAGTHLSIVGGVFAALVLAVVGMTLVFGGGGVVFAGGGTATPGPDAKQVAADGTEAAASAIVTAAKSALERLVANGTINQSQEDTVMRDVASGRIDAQALVSRGVLSDAQMQAVQTVLTQVKQSFAPTGAGAASGGAKISTDTSPPCDRIGTKLAQAVKDGKMTQEQANLNRQQAGCTAATP